MPTNLDDFDNLADVVVIVCPQCGYREYMRLHAHTAPPDAFVWHRCPVCDRPADHGEPGVYV